MIVCVCVCVWCGVSAQGTKVWALRQKKHTCFTSPSIKYKEFALVLVHISVCTHPPTHPDITSVNDWASKIKIYYYCDYIDRRIYIDLSK